MWPKCGRGLVVLSLCAFAHMQVHAQRGTGVVRDLGTVTPLAGAVVSALDSLRHPLARTISDAAGRYSVDLPATAIQLAVIRIGYQPRIVPLPRQRITLVALDVGMTKVATLLSTVVVNDERVCAPGQERSGALSLWEQARAGLLSAVVAREALPAIATIMSYRRVIDSTTGRVVQASHRMTTGRTTRPFFSGDAPQLLAQRGYVVNEAGSLGFRAPDADVLLDDSFAATHCFSVRAADRMHAGEIGLAFEPARGRDTIVDVSGTLWMDSGSPKLRSIEFAYTDRELALKRAGAGGTLHFRTMPDGVTFVDDWTLHASRTSEAGGMVVRAAWPDGEHWEAPMIALSGVVTERGVATPFPGAIVVLEATHDTVVADSVGRFSLFPVLPGRYVIHAIDTAISTFLAPRLRSREVDVLSRQALEVHLELPERTEAVTSLCEGFEFLSEPSMLVGRIGDIARTPPSKTAGISVVASWTRKTGPVNRESRTVRADDDGRFFVCGLPRDRTVLVSATRMGFPLAQSVITVDSVTAINALAWTLDFQAFDKSVATRLAGVRGHVTRAGAGLALAGAEVWVPSLDRRTVTDSTGAFHLDSLPPGLLLVQVRNLGFTVQRDTLTLTAAQETIRDYALVSQMNMLDTVRTVAAKVKYVTHGLQGFEDRRATGGDGQFIPESTLRQHDLEALSRIIMSRVTGLKLVSDVMGLSYLVSSRQSCTTRGGSCTPCYVTTYVDGTLWYSASMGSTRGAQPLDVSHFSVSELAGVEFYPNSATTPREYSTANSACGTLLLWTRER